MEYDLEDFERDAADIHLSLRRMHTLVLEQEKKIQKLSAALDKAVDYYNDEVPYPGEGGWKDDGKEIWKKFFLGEEE